MSEDTPTDARHPALRLSYGFDATRPPDSLDVWDAGDDDYVIPPRQVRQDRPIESDTTPVQVRGEALHPVLWPAAGKGNLATSHAWFSPESRSASTPVGLDQPPQDPARNILARIRVRGRRVSGDGNRRKYS